jgi:hypothetical protein
VGESKKIHKGFRSGQSPKQWVLTATADFSGNYAVQRIEKSLLGLEMDFRQFSRLCLDIKRNTNVISSPLPRKWKSLFVEIRIGGKPRYFLGENAEITHGNRNPVKLVLEFRRISD